MDQSLKAAMRRSQILKSYVGWEDFIAVALILLGALGYFQGPIPFILHLTDFYMDIRSDLIGIGITVLILDNVNEMYRRRTEKEHLKIQMGSPDHGFAIEAVRQLAARGWLFDGSLQRADLYKADLSGANLFMADLRKANLALADLSGAELLKANLHGANLNETDLSGANLNKAGLRGANLHEAHLNGASLYEANLSGADLNKADLCRACLNDAYLSGADLNKANLRGASLYGVDLWEADLSGATVTIEQLTQAKSLMDATMPDGKVYDPAIHTEVARLRKEAGLDQESEKRS